MTMTTSMTIAAHDDHDAGSITARCVNIQISDQKFGQTPSQWCPVSSHAFAELLVLSTPRSLVLW